MARKQRKFKIKKPKRLRPVEQKLPGKRLGQISRNATGVSTRAVRTSQQTVQGFDVLQKVPQTQRKINPEFQNLRQSFNIPKSPRSATFEPKISPKTTRLTESSLQPKQDISIFGRRRPLSLEEEMEKKDIICRVKIVKGKKKTICKPRKPKKKKGKRSPVEKEFDFFKGIL